jgi:exonuclease SbcD
VRFLHTADWHVGKPLRGRSRIDEYAAALDQVAAAAAEARVDCVLMAGDVFDSPAPPPEAEKLVYDFLARLVSEGIPCVLVAGNHDHPRRLGALARLLEGVGLHIRPEVRPARLGGVVEIASRDASETARVAVLPFVPERKVVDACQVLGPEHVWYEAYAARIEQILSFLARDFAPDSVNLIVAHLLVSGARVGTGERALHLGDIYGVTPQQIPAAAQYVALGHLHRPQQVDAPAPTYYSGSLIELDFGERDQEKRVVLVEAHPRRPPRVESIPLTAGRRLRDVSGSLEELRALAPELGDAWLRVRVRVDAPVPGVAEQVREQLPNAVEVSLDYERLAPSPAPASTAQLAPAELYREFHRRREGTDPDPKLAALFDSVYEEASRE